MAMLRGGNEGHLSRLRTRWGEVEPREGGGDKKGEVMGDGQERMRGRGMRRGKVGRKTMSEEEERETTGLIANHSQEEKGERDLKRRK